MDKGMKKILSALALILALSLTSCKVDEPDYSGMKAPSIELMYDTIYPDLNRVDNTPVVCVIFSQAGLAKVSLFKTEAGVESSIAEITEFRDIHQYSLKETPSWNTDITALTVRAEDKAGRKATATIGVDVTPVLPAPVITFEMEKIEINERNEDPNEIQTRFDVVSSNALQSVKVSMFTAEGIVDVPLQPAFHIGDETYSFDQTITYLEGYRGLQVTATDANGKMKIETLPVNYIPAPVPVFTPKEGTTLDRLIVRSTDSKSFSFHIDSEAGLSNVEVSKVSKTAQGDEVLTSVNVAYYSPETDFSTDYAYTLESFDPACHAIEFTATDKLNHKAVVRIPTVVDMRYAENIVIASQYNAKTPLVLEEFPGQEAYCFFSIKDFKTYSLQYFWEMENRRNIDLFYFSWNYASANDNGARIMKASEERSGQDSERYLADVTGGIPELGTGSDWGNRNATYMKKLTDAYKFDFDNVALDDLLTPAVQNYIVQGKVAQDWYGYKPGECLLFKTGPLSTCPNAMGIIRFDVFEGSKTNFGSAPVYLVISIKAQIVD